MTYQEQLQDPRWLFLRNEILLRDGCCTKCGNRAKLQVHHKKYTGKAWEAPKEDLTTLCATCHKEHHEEISFGPYSVIYHKIEKTINEKTPEAFRTASVLRWRVKHRNELLFLQADLAAELKLSVPTVSRHLKQLRELGILVPNPQAPNAAWLIHPLFAWYGGAKEKEKYWDSLSADHPFRKVGVEPEPTMENDDENA